MHDKGSTSVQPVLDAYEHAVLARTPQQRYHAGFDSAYIWGLLSLLPTPLFHRLFLLLSPTGPVPAAVLARNKKD